MHKFNFLPLSNYLKSQKYTTHPTCTLIYILREYKKFNFWSLDEKIRMRFIDRLYNALIELLNRFHEDWIENKIDKEKVLIVRFDNMMSNFESVMDDIISFTTSL